MKVLHADLAEDPSVFKRFEREARALRKLAHPNIVPFYGLYHTLDMTFLLERYIDGPTLKEELRRRGGEPLPMEDILVYLKAVTSALGYAHAQGVVHCDVKPGNVMVDRGGQVYLTDFGVARHAESTTTTIGYAGTAAYMAPEQCRGEAVSGATDIYGLGVMLYEMVTGRRPFRGDEAGTESGGTTAGERIRWAHVHLAPVDPREWNAEIPEGLSAAILKAMAKAPAERWGSVRELYEAACGAAAIGPLEVSDRIDEGRKVGQTEGATRSIAAPRPGMPTRSHTRGGNAPGTALSRRVVGPASALVVLVLLAAGAFWLLRRESASGPRSGALSTDGGSVSGDQSASQMTGAVMGLRAEPTPSVPAGTTAENTVDGAILVYVPGGEFLMGLAEDDVQNLVSLAEYCTVDVYASALPQHPVFVDGFWIYRTEVTNGMYRLCVESGTCEPPASQASQTRELYYGSPAYDQYPVVHVDWHRAATYCQWVGGRLPTEAEWERAARGSDGRLFPWGDQIPQSDVANVAESLVGDTVAVGSFPGGASPYGVLDLSGNVYEWVEDWYAADYYRAMRLVNPTGPDYADPPVRGVRGGSWGFSWCYAAAGYRDWWEPYQTGSGVGFRCVLDAEKVD
jgi:serine/threonine-protein kinase